MRKQNRHLVYLNYDDSFNDVYNQGCTYAESHIAGATKFLTVASNIYGPSVWNLFHTTHLAPKHLISCMIYFINCSWVATRWQ
jgi:hypothetical protein